MKPVTVYSTDYCPFCDRVKAFFDSKNVPYTDVDITNDAEKRQELIAQTKMRTVPQVFIGDTFVGGCDDVLAMDARGELDPLLSE